MEGHPVAWYTLEALLQALSGCPPGGEDAFVGAFFAAKATAQNVSWPPPTFPLRTLTLPHFPPLPPALPSLELPPVTTKDTKPEKEGKQRKRPSSETLSPPRAHAALGSQEATPKKKAKASSRVKVNRSNRDVDYDRKMRARVFSICWGIESPEDNFGYMLQDLQVCFIER